MTVEKSPPVVVIDGRNVAYSGNGKADWNRVLIATTHISSIGIRVIVVMPHWAADDEVKKQIRKISQLHLVDVGDDKESDDKTALGLCIVEDGYYVSRDKKMHKHLKGELIDRAWCASRRIDFHFDGEGGFVPHYPESWHPAWKDATETMASAKPKTREVRE